MSLKKRVAEAGLKPESGDRLRAALQRLSAEGLKISPLRWDGTRCDLLVADVDDGYGYHACQSVLRQGGAVLALSAVNPAVVGARATLSSHAVQETLENALRVALMQDRPAEKNGVVVDIGQAQAGSLLSKLPSPDGVDIGDMLARRGPLEILIRRSASRILAVSQRDLLSARSLLLDDQWTVVRATTNPARHKFTTSLSLDAFLLGACIAAENRLPPLPARRYGLSLWPDVGKLGEHVDALRIIAELLRAPLLPTELQLRTSASAKRVNAILWATHAAGILQSPAEEMVAPVPGDRLTEKSSRFSSALTMLKRRFGIA